MKMARLTAYVAGSAVLAAGVITYAALERPNFYSAAVYLSQSNACLMILCNMALVLAGSFMYGLQQVLFGPLRPLETEQLWERGWFAMMEWVFAMSTFRDEFGVWFLVMFLSLFTGKIWGWIAEGRVEQLEQQAPNDPRLFHGRLIASLAIYVFFAVQMFWYSFDIVLYEARPGMTIMFVFEFAILCIAAMATCLRYAIWVQEHRIIKQQVAQAVQLRKAEIRKARQEAEEQQKSSGEGVNDTSLATLPREEDIDENEIEAPGWESKKGWLFALDITADLLKLLAYMAFFTILTVFYGIPIYIIRDLYMTMRSFTKRVSDYLKFQAATKDMDTRYPNATPEELAADNTCIVCREEMRPVDPQGVAVPALGQAMHQRQKPKKLPCGHILHFGCLSSWLERQQACPICRRSVFAAPQPPRGQAAPANGQAPAPAVANHPHPNAQPRQRNEGRVFRLGPIQLQFGGRAGRPDDQELINVMARLVQNRARERAVVATGQAGAVVQDPAPHDIAHTDGAAAGQIGATDTQIHPGIRSAAARMALNTIEQQIQQEIQALNIQGQRANIVRSLLNELDRARGIPQPPPRPQQILTPGGLVSVPQGVTSAGFPTYFRPEQFNINQQTIPISRAVPGFTEPSQASRAAGVVVPQGWTLVPLNPMGEGSPAPVQTSSAIPPMFANTIAPTRTPGVANATLPNPMTQFLAAAVPNGTAPIPQVRPSASHGPFPPPPVNGNTFPLSAPGGGANATPASSSQTHNGTTLSNETVSAPQPTQPPVPAPSWSFPSPPGTSVSEPKLSLSSNQSSDKGKARMGSESENTTIARTDVEPPTPVAQSEEHSHQPSVEEAEDE